MKEELGKKEDQYKGIDVVKFVMAILVVVLHTHPFYGVNDKLNFITADILGRIAVPFFFTATGFLLMQKNEKDNDRVWERTKKYILKILKLYIIWTAFYLPVIIYTNVISNNEGIIYGILTSVRDFIFVGSYAHLWYLPATAAGVLIVFFLKEKIGEGWSGFCFFLLFLAGLLAQSYFGILKALAEESKVIWGGLLLIKKIMVTTRNGIFFGSFFLYMGGWIAQRYREIHLKKWVIWLGVALSVIFLGYEEVWLHRLGWVRERDMYFMLIPAAFFLLLASLHMNIKISTIFLRKMGMNIYFIHLFFKFIYRQFLGEHNENGWRLFLFVFCNTLFWAYLLCRIHMRRIESRNERGGEEE